jgi:lysophospholipase L1-like esterase
VAAALHRKLRNFGQGSALTSDTLAPVLEYDPVAADIVVVETMLNDVRRFGGSEIGLRQYGDATAELLTHLTSAPGPPRILVAVDPDILAWSSFPPFDRGSPSARAAYLGRTREIVAGFPGVDCVDLSIGWDPDSHLADDGVHPNAAGTRFIAQTIARRLDGEDAG